MNDDDPSLAEFLDDPSRHTKQVKRRIDPDVYETAKERSAHGEIAKEFRELIYEMAYGDARTERERLRSRREEIDEELDNVRAKIRELQATEENLRDEKSRVERELEQKDDVEEKVDARIEMHIDNLWAGQHIVPENPALKKTASIAGVTTEDIIDRIRDVVPFPEHAFTENVPGKQEWNELEATRFDRSLDDEE